MRKFIYFIFIMLCFETIAFAENVYIVHGSFYGGGAGMPNRTTVCGYDIIGIGRGSLENFDAVWVSFVADERGTNVYTDAILLLEADESHKRSEHTDSATQKRVKSLCVLGNDPRIGILPYSAELWNELLAKTDEELLGVIPTDEEAWKCAYQYALELGASPDKVWAEYPRTKLQIKQVPIFFMEEKSQILVEAFVGVNSRGRAFILSHYAYAYRFEKGRDPQEYLVERYSKYPEMMPFLLGPDGLPVKMDGRSGISDSQGKISE